MRNRIPLLRSPPFPWVDVATAAVSCVQEGATGGAIDGAALVGLIRAARVGGTFWGAWPAIADDARCWMPIADMASADRAVADGRVGGDVIATTTDTQVATRLRTAGATVFVGVVDPWWMLAHVPRVDAPNDAEETMLAGIAGVPVVDGGTGVSDDRIFQRIMRDVAYRDPFTRVPANADAVVALLAHWRARIDRNRSIGAATGIAGWKREAVERMLWAGGDMLTCRSGAAAAVDAAARAGGMVAAWPARAPRGLDAAAAGAGVTVASIEDGFLRSAGLGSDGVPPLSIVFDRQAPHYDAAQASELEAMIEAGGVSPALVARAEAAIAMLVATGLGKYSVAPGTARRPAGATRVVLVTGQVEDDESVRHGGGAVAGNLDLLRRVRAYEPGAYVIFRPHPDIEAGHRTGHVPDGIALRHVDRVDRETPVAALYAMVDAVHVLTSLAGFEALLRGCEVVVHGLPFYAGWGLTRDLRAIPRRTARPTLAELVATVIFVYPHYLDPVTQLPCPADVLIDRLVTGARQPSSLFTRLRRLRRHLPRRRGRLAEMAHG